MIDEQVSIPEGLDLKEISPPVPLWDLDDFLFRGGFIAAVMVLLLLAGFALLRWLRRPRFPALPDAPQRRALRDLRELCARAESMPTVEVAGLASGVVRTFLHRQYGMLAAFSTSGELAGHAGGEEPPPPPAAVPLVSCLQQLDALRFAALPAAGRECAALLERLIMVLENTQQADSGEVERGEPAAAVGSIDQPFDLATAAHAGREHSAGAQGKGATGGNPGMQVE